VGASESDEFLRASWRALVSGRRDAERFVFVDECSTNTSLLQIYGWSRRGFRAYFEVPRNWGTNVALLSSMSFEGMGPSGGGGTHHPRSLRGLPGAGPFVPSLKPARIVLIDNLSSHKGGRVRELIEGSGVASFSTCRPTPRTSNGMRRSETETPRGSYDGGERTEFAEGGP
jgi:hypothetical protein